MSDTECNCQTRVRGGRHHHTCPVACPPPPTPGPDATFADIAKYLAGNLVPPSDVVAGAVEAELHHLRTGERLAPPLSSSSAMVARHIILNHRLVAAPALLKTQGGARRRLQLLWASSRRAAAAAAANRHGAPPADIADFGSEFTLQWFIGALDSRQHAWTDQYMLSVARAMHADQGTIGRVWRGDRPT